MKELSSGEAYLGHVVLVYVSNFELMIYIRSSNRHEELRALIARSWTNAW